MNRCAAEEIHPDPGGPALDPCAIAQLGDLAALERHLARGGACDLRCDRGFTMLDLAAAHGHLLLVERLLAAGANVRTLHAAVAGGRAEVVRALLAAGAQVDGRDEAGLTPLHQAICQSDRALVAALLRAGADATAEVGDTGALALARRVGDPRLVGLLRQRGARR